MDRRRFLCQITAATAAGAAASLELASVAVPRQPGDTTRPGGKTRSVTYHVKGFTCITCAVGLEVMLRGLNGVTRAGASYPANNVVIGFDANDSSQGHDRLDLTAYTSLTPDSIGAEIQIVASGPHTVITINGDSVTLLDVKADAIGKDDFIFS